MKLGVHVGLGPGHIVLDAELRTQVPLPQRGIASPFASPFCCGQMAGWIKMPLGVEVGLGPCDFVLDGDPVPPTQKWGGAPSPIFGPCPLWPNGWMDQDVTWHGRKP